MTEKQTKEISELLKQQARERRNAKLREQRANETPEQKEKRLAKQREQARKQRERIKQDKEKHTELLYMNAFATTKTFITNKATENDLKLLEKLIKEKLKK